MAGIVYVDAISNAILLCEQNIEKFKITSDILLQKQQLASPSWTDSKYIQLSNIVTDCVNSLNKPLNELQDCVVKLNCLRKALMEYEATNLLAVHQLGTISGSIRSSASVGISHSESVMSCAPGEYCYEVTDKNGRHAYGQLIYVKKSDRVRSQAAQSSAGGIRRRYDDDGGHLIGACFGGLPTSENLFPQNRHLNRVSYRQMEARWLRLLRNGSQVFVNIYTSSSNLDMREDAIYGTYTVVSPNGSRYTESFSYANENRATREAWEDELDNYNIE